MIVERRPGLRCMSYKLSGYEIWSGGVVCESWGLSYELRVFGVGWFVSRGVKLRVTSFKLRKVCSEKREV